MGALPPLLGPLRLEFRLGPVGPAVGVGRTSEAMVAVDPVDVVPPCWTVFAIK